MTMTTQERSALRADVTTAMKRQSAAALAALDAIRAATTRAERAALRAAAQQTEARYSAYLAEQLDKLGQADQAARLRATIAR